MAEQVDADMFISSHHNSLSEQVDSNKVEGIEVYYYNGQCARIGSAMSGIKQDGDACKRCASIALEAGLLLGKGRTARDYRHQTPGFHR